MGWKEEMSCRRAAIGRFPQGTKNKVITYLELFLFFICMYNVLNMFIMTYRHACCFKFVGYDFLAQGELIFLFNITNLHLRLRRPFLVY